MVQILLALAILIAVLGIINTLALSVLERTRELGLLRAVGLGGPQTMRMVTVEAVVISVFGALLGVVVGAGLGAAVVRALEGRGHHELALPWAQMGAVPGAGRGGRRGRGGAAGDPGRPAQRAGRHRARVSAPARADHGARCQRHARTWLATDPTSRRGGTAASAGRPAADRPARNGRSTPARVSRRCTPSAGGSSSPRRHGEHRRAGGERAGHPGRRVLDRHAALDRHAQQPGRVRYGSGSGLGAVTSSPQTTHVEVVPAQRVQRHLDQPPAGGGDQRGRAARPPGPPAAAPRAGPPRPGRSANSSAHPVAQPRTSGASAAVRLARDRRAGSASSGPCCCRPSPAGAVGQRAAGPVGQLVQRDVPDLFAVDERAVHVEEHRGRLS